MGKEQKTEEAIIGCDLNEAEIRSLLKNEIKEEMMLWGK